MNQQEYEQALEQDLMDDTAERAEHYLADQFFLEDFVQPWEL